MGRIELIGISGPALTGDQTCLLRGCLAVAVSRRHRPLVEGLCARLIEITPLASMLDQVEEALADGNVAVLASGDPLFFGIGRSLIERFGPKRIKVHPAVSSVQAPKQVAGRTLATSGPMPAALSFCSKRASRSHSAFFCPQRRPWQKRNS